MSTLQVAVTGGLDFSVRGLPGQSYGSVQIVLLINEDNTWNTIRVNYLITGRSDFLLGFFVAGIFTGIQTCIWPPKTLTQQVSRPMSPIVFPLKVHILQLFNFQE